MEGELLEPSHLCILSNFSSKLAEWIYLNAWRHVHERIIPLARLSAVQGNSGQFSTVHNYFKVVQRRSAWCSTFQFGAARFSSVQRISGGYSRFQAHAAAGFRASFFSHVWITSCENLFYPYSLISNLSRTLASFRPWAMSAARIPVISWTTRVIQPLSQWEHRTPFDKCTGYLFALLLKNYPQ